MASIRPPPWANLAPCCSTRKLVFVRYAPATGASTAVSSRRSSSTGIYCRPICPVRPPKRENMRFFSSAAAAEGAGYRPCLRCRPERAPGLASVDAASRLAGAAIAGIEEHAVSNARVGDLAASLGVSDRHLRRVTEAELGVSPIELAQTQKLLLAKRLLARDLAQADRHRVRFRIRQRAAIQRAVQIALWIESAQHPPHRRCRREVSSASSTSARRSRGRACSPTCGCAPFPGVESVDATHYRRTVAIGEHRGFIAVSLAAERHGARGRAVARACAGDRRGDRAGQASVRSRRDARRGGATCCRKIRCSPAVVRRFPGCGYRERSTGSSSRCGRCSGSRYPSRRRPRSPGAGRARSARPSRPPCRGAHRSGAERRPHVRVSPPTRSRHSAWSARGRAAWLRSRRPRRSGASCSALAANVEEQIERLTALPGIGPWTAQYIAMRALRWPDAFPGGDLMVLRAAGLGKKELRARAEGWRPWRAYATHYLWQSLGVVSMISYT